MPQVEFYQISAGIPAPHQSAIIIIIAISHMCEGHQKSSMECMHMNCRDYHMSWQVVVDNRRRRTMFEIYPCNIPNKKFLHVISDAMEK